MSTWTFQRSRSSAKQHCQELPSESYHDFLGFCIGALIGLVAWHWSNAPIAAIAFPFLFPLMRGRRGVYIYALGYHLAAVYGLMGFASTWFNDSLVMGAVAWFCLGLLASLVWPIFISGRAQNLPVKSALQVCAGMLCSLIPPFALVLDGQPLSAWGFILPGWGFAGVVFAFCCTGVVCAFMTWVKKAGYRVYASAALLCQLFALGLLMPAQDYAKPAGVIGIDTYFGKPPSNDGEHVERFAEIRKIISKTNTSERHIAGASVIVLPENTLNLDDPALDFMITSDVLRPLKRVEKAAVIGKLGYENGQYLNQAVFISNGAIKQTVNQRQPAMLSMWRPWSKEHFTLDWSRDTKIDLGNGLVGRVLFCYEEYIPALFMLDELRGGHAMEIIISSNWSASDPRLPEVQRLHSLGMSKLFARPVVRAVNYAAELAK